VICKLSIVIPAYEHAGAILDTNHVPEIGERLNLGDALVEVIELEELLPARGDFRFFHATCRLVSRNHQPGNG
jgi:hypothetical protein